MFQMLGRSAPELAYAYGLRRREVAPSPALLHHIFGSLRGTVLHLGALHDFDTRLYSANRMTAVEIKGCTHLPPTKATSPIAVLQAYGPRLQVPCILSLLEELLKASGRSPTFLALDLRSMEISRLLPELSSRGYEHFKVSRQSLFGCTDEVCAGGPLGDEATDWRHGVIWRNASSVASDALAIRLLQGRSLEHFVLHAAMAGPQRRLGLCLTGQLRSRNGVADLQQVLRRFASFDVFAVVPSQDCARACEVLAPLQTQVLCVDSLFMSPEELQWIREGPKADPDVCPGHHCVYVWRDVDTCGRLLHRYIRRQCFAKLRKERSSPAPVGPALAASLCDLVTHCQAKVGEVPMTKEDMDRSLNICMVSDFFHPGLGGVEMHIYQLSECLIQRGHKVIVVTHFRGTRQGVRYMRNGLKVYYLPFLPFHDNCTFPTFLSFFPLIRKVLIRERIDIVHGHQATSNLAHECVLHARTMGYHTVYTDHSLFGFADAACIHVNKLLKFFLTNVEHCICVSHTNRENLVLRASLNPANVSVIPNAVDTRRFTPDTSKRAPRPAVTVVVVSRLTYRKGVDLLVGAVPETCRRNPDVRWVIGGSGPKRLLLEEMIERAPLKIFTSGAQGIVDRVELLGSVPHEDVRKVLVRGDIFLNTSLTEAFCIAIVEAAACGLMVVSTNVGGIPEVLPPHMTRLAAPCVDDIVQALEDALGSLPPPEAAATFHEEVRGMYSWLDIAERTEKVYRKVVKLPRVCLRQRLLRFLRVGPVSGKLFLLLAALDTLLFWCLKWLHPVEEVECAVDVPRFPGSGLPERQRSREPAEKIVQKPCRGANCSFRVSYWRVARMRLDLRIAIFPKDVAVFDEENTIWAYAIPDRQWIAMPDRFAMGPPRLMDAYFTTYRWMLDKRSWQHYDPGVRTACARRGHLQLEPGESGEHRLRAFGKLWPCPEHSARGLAYPGPENVLEARMLTFQASANPGVTFRLRSDICFSHLTQIPDSSCKQLPERHPHGYWTHDWDTSPLTGSMFQAYLQRQAASPGSAKTETRLLPYDGIFAAGLADFFLAEWGAKESRGQSRPPKILILGAGRGALAEQLARWGLPTVAIDGNCMVEFTAEHRGLCADVVHPRGLGTWAEAACGAEVPPASRVDPELKALGSKETKVWCHWLQGVSKSDWALALNLLPEIPRHLLPRLARELSLGREGVILTMPIGRPLQDAKRRDLVRALRHRGYVVDRDASRHVGALGGLLCCPWNANAIVLRKRRKETTDCSARVIQQLTGSLPCVLHQNYGCVHGGVWVHFGCRGYFTNGGHGSTLCSSPLSEYAECPWQGVKTELPRQRKLRAARRPVALVARALFRSDMAHAGKVQSNASSRSSQYTRLFGEALAGLYEAMDPLSFGAGVWPESLQERLFLVATLRALKLAAAGSFVGHNLARARARIGRSHRALQGMFSMIEIKAKFSGPAERQRASLMLECLRVIADLNHAGLHSLSQQGHVDVDEMQWTIPKLIVALEKLMEAAPEKKLAWFERLSGTWHLRVDSDDPWGRYHQRAFGAFSCNA
eukprot:s287_g2.t6